MTQIYPTTMTGAGGRGVAVRDASGSRLPLQVVQAFLTVALGNAAKQPDRTFEIQRDGWGYSWRDVAAGLVGVPSNVRLPC